MTVTRLTGGEVLDRAGRRRSDVVVDDEAGTIVAVGTDLADGANGDTATLDATGAVVCPGFVDLHVHLRQPGFEAAGTIESGARSAALGGFTALVAAADTDPCPDDAVVIAEVLALAKSALCEVIPAAALTLGRGGEAMARYQGLVDAGVRFFSDADTPVADARVIRNALDYLVSLGQTAGVTLVAGQRLRHPLDEGGLVNEGEWSARLGLAGRPAVAEELAVGREIALARLTGASIHLQQVSTAGAVALIRAAKAEAVPVTAEVSPHHLVLTEAVLAGFDPTTKLDPPLRTEADVVALRAAVADGTIDAIATAHAPYTVDAVERPFDAAPFGAIGLETALAALLTESGLGLEQLLPALSWQPASIAGIADRHGTEIAEGSPANLTVVDPDATWTVEPARFGGYAANSPLTGRELRGRVRHTVRSGEPVVVDGEAIR